MFAESGLVKVIVSLVAGLLLLVVLAIGSLMWFVRKRQPMKRYRKEFLLSFSLCIAETSKQSFVGLSVFH